MLVDATTQKVFAVCVGMPTGKSYPQDCKAASDLMIDIGRKEEFMKAELHHKRGDEFPAFNAGILGGHGPPQPYNLRNAGHEEAVEQLLSNESIRRLALYQDGTRPWYIFSYSTHSLSFQRRSNSMLPISTTTTINTPFPSANKCPSCASIGTSVSSPPLPSTLVHKLSHTSTATA